ncbi:hypothetical protein ACI797_15385 [Geodermatophilus sp. SYSU D00691]
MANVEFTAEHEWGRGKHIPLVPPERVRVHGGVGDPSNIATPNTASVLVPLSADPLSAT